MATTPIAVDPAKLSERFAQVSTEYRRLAVSLNALGLELAALRSALNASDVPCLPAASSPIEEEPRPILRAQLLGPFRLMVGLHEVSAELPGQAQTVLKYLISHRKRPVSRESLLDLLWPDVDPTTGLGRLRVVMHTLRKALTPIGEAFDGKRLVIAQGNNLILNPELDLQVDVEEFERHWHNGWKLRRDGRLVEALDHYEQAEALYVGDYLEDEAYADWTLLKREALRDAYSTILTMLATVSRDTGDDMGAIIWSQKLLAQDDCREDAYRHLIMSHANLGQPARALYWYNLCVRTLRRELGIEPGPETQALLAAHSLRDRVPHSLPLLTQEYL